MNSREVHGLADRVTPFVENENVNLENFNARITEINEAFGALDDPASGTIPQIQQDIAALETNKADKILTGYTKPSTGGTLAPTDTVNEALGKLEAGLDAAEVAIADKAETSSYTATLTAAGWQGSAAPYTQTVVVAGILATDEPIVGPVYSDTLATAISQKEAWSMVSDAAAAAGSIVFECFEDKPTIDIPIQIKVVR
jgi:hypothetical protein